MKPASHSRTKGRLVAEPDCYVPKSVGRKKKITCGSMNTAIREDGASCRGEQGQRLVYFVLLKWTDLFLFFFLFFFPLLHNLLARMHMLERVTEAEAGRQDDFQCFLVGH